MNWWEESEARALRVKAGAAVGLSLWQRLRAAGIDPDLAFVPAYDLGQLYQLAADFIKLVEGLLLAADGDGAAVRRHGLALSRWTEAAVRWTEDSAAGFNQLLDALQLDAEALSERVTAVADTVDARPEEQGKLDGRFRHWHLLYERLDLKLASVGLEESVHRGLARTTARVYEECLMTVRTVAALEKDGTTRFGMAARNLLALNTTWHFDLGPHVLGHRRPAVRPTGAYGLQTWLLLAFSNPLQPRGA